MNYTTEFLVRARKELLAAWDWYEDKQPGLGGRFLNEIERGIKQIEQNPERYPIRGKKFREGKIKVFPFLLIYRINQQKSSIVIASVFHMSRNPKKKPVKLGKA